MQLLLKIIISVSIILLATTLSRKFPAIAGLIGVMPLTGALVIAWVYLENKNHPEIFHGVVKGALWGLVPTALFYLVILCGAKKVFSIPVALLAGFAVWLAAACVHQWALK